MLLHESTALFAHPAGANGIGHEQFERLNETVPVVDDKASSPRPYRFRSAARRPGYDGETAGGGFEEDNSKTFLFQTEPSGTARHGEHVHLSIAIGELVPRNVNVKVGAYVEGLSDLPELMLESAASHDHRSHSMPGFGEFGNGVEHLGVTLPRDKAAHTPDNDLPTR